jgi:hypothetical protein
MPPYPLLFYVPLTELRGRGAIIFALIKDYAIHLCNFVTSETPDVGLSGDAVSRGTPRNGVPAWAKMTRNRRYYYFLSYLFYFIYIIDNIFVDCKQ